MGVHIGPGVLGLTVLGEDLGGNLVDGRDEVEEVVVRHVLEGELTLSSVTGVSLSEDGVSVTGNNTARVKSVPQVLLNVVLGDVGANIGLDLENPLKNLLVGTSVERTSQTVETSGQGQEGGRESGTNQVGGVGRDVTTLVIGVDGQVESQKLNKLLVLAESEQGGKVLGVVSGGIGGAELAILEDVAVDAGSNGRELGEEVNRVLVGVLPELLLVDTLLVSLGEGRLSLKSVDGNGELGHGVEGRRGAVDQLLDVLGELGSGGKLSRESLNLGLGGDLTGQQEPEETLRKGLVTTGALGELLLEIGDGLATEANTLFRVEDGTFPDEGLDTTLATVDLVEEDLTNDGVSVLLSESLDLVDLLGEELSEALLKSLYDECVSGCLIMQRGGNCQTRQEGPFLGIGESHAAQQDKKSNPGDATEDENENSQAEIFCTPENRDIHHGRVKMNTKSSIYVFISSKTSWAHTGRTQRRQKQPGNVTIIIKER